MIKSDFITCRNVSNKKIVGVYDHIAYSRKRKPFIIIPPAFGETKTDSLALSYFLVMNGFNVLRYDATNHPGESAGDIFNFTLEGGKNDLISIMDFIEKRFGPSTIGIVAKSLGWRTSIKAAVKDKRIKYILGIGGIVDLQMTLKTIYQEDLVDMVIKNIYTCWKFIDIFGFEVGRNFLETAIRDHYHNLQSTKNDVKKISIPITYLYSENDVWIEVEDIKRIMGKKKFDACVQIIPQAMHQIDENPLAALFVFKQTVINSMKHLRMEYINDQMVLKPDLRRVAMQNRLEKKRLRPYELTKEKEKEFWQEYLVKYSCINKIKDYKDYLDSIVKLMGGIRKNETILDAGCGPGYLAACFLAHNSEVPYSYVGTDFTKPVLKQARAGHLKLMSNVSKKKNISDQNVNLSYICADLECSKKEGEKINLCFKTQTFDKICCSLLISYLKAPLLFLKDCFRVIKPSGTIIVSSLKPHSDLSQIYRNFTLQTKSTKELEHARKLLSGAGMIKIKGSQGYYLFYTEEKLIQLLRKAGFRNVQCYRTFDNQVNLAVAMK